MATLTTGQPFDPSRTNEVPTTAPTIDTLLDGIGHSRRRLESARQRITEKLYQFGFAYQSPQDKAVTPPATPEPEKTMLEALAREAEDLAVLASEFEWLNARIDRQFRPTPGIDHGHN